MIRTLFGAAATLAATLAAAAPAVGQETPGETVEALYEMISGPVGEARRRDRFRARFIEDARMTVVTPG